MITQVQRAPSALRDVPRVNPGRLKIAITAGVGQGRTLLSAFDAALWQSGVHNYNLISLSSVIPPASDIALCDRYEPPEREFGHRLYVVKAEMRSAEVGAVIAAGLGWLQWGDARGIFVEHELQARGQSQAEVETALAGQITASLSDLAQRRGLAFVPEQVGMHLLSAVVGPAPACVLVLAVYQAEGWDGKPATSGRRPL
jgi:arginine decarboxylase